MPGAQRGRGRWGPSCPHPAAGTCGGHRGGGSIARGGGSRTQHRASLGRKGDWGGKRGQGGGGGGGEGGPDFCSPAPAWLRPAWPPWCRGCFCLEQDAASTMLGTTSLCPSAAAAGGETSVPVSPGGGTARGPAPSWGGHHAATAKSRAKPRFPTEPRISAQFLLPRAHRNGERSRGRRRGLPHTHTAPQDSAPPVPERVGPAPRPGPSGARDGERMA